MKQVSVIFSKHKGFNLFSWLIMKSLDTPFSHVAVKMVDGDTNQVVFYQASGLTVNVVSEESFMNEEVIIYQKDIFVSDKVYIAGKTFAIAQLGKPYGIPAIFGFVAQIALSKIGIKIENPAKSNGSQFVCSQFAAAYIEAADGITLDVTDMTPKALYEVIQTLPYLWM